ncbi:hypothetical protein Dimus_002131 [Dionaea muscipula]
MERIYVTVRPRPLSREDASSSPWRICGNTISYHNQSPKFEFDRIFGEECKTKEVYESRTKEIVAAAVRGFNGTVFAYGQTNSGKTHTMRGSANEPGVILLAVRELFEIIQEVTNREFLLRMSYMEIYNEEINDLLAPEHRRLQIHESLERGIYVAGLREEIVASPEQVLDLMDFGESHRHIGETNMNTYSSRSHTIFRMIIESRDTAEDEDMGDSCDAVRVSVLNLVDLAGSERAAKTGAEGVRLKEGSHINKSLMTLGSVIKKLSEGAESNGGHVPYRDSKLTRILQPALGGNANTAIICNITLAQIHADETKSSLQFASRALRVTNCACVNEILTDAALLKRQKNEIEELRAKLQASHSEHLEDQILNLRNTLLQTELEKERIALELEEEKRAQIEREKRLQEQAKKIENLSSMVLYSNRDEIRDNQKRDKRRGTWCPSNLPWETAKEASCTAESRTSVVGSMRVDRKVGPLLPFEELVCESTECTNTCFKQEENQNIVLEERLPDPSTLLNVTSRRKPSKKKSLPAENNELLKLRADYQDLLQRFESQRTMYDSQIDYLTRKLKEVCLDEHDHPTDLTNNTTLPDGKGLSSKELDTILVIKQLQQQVKDLELEKASSQLNLNKVVELASEQNICASKQYEELYKELLTAKEEARLAHDQLASTENVVAMEKSNLDSMIKLLLEVQQTLSEVFELSSTNISSSAGELLQNYSSILNLFLDLKSSVGQSSEQLNFIIRGYGKLNDSLKNRVMEVETEKVLVQNECRSLQEHIQELMFNSETSEKVLAALNEQFELEKRELLSQVQILEKKVSSLSSSLLFKEKESLRKDLEKTRTKLKETELKFKNTLQEKTRIESERANAEREIKKLHSQKAFLERDFSRRESLAGRGHSSTFDRSAKENDFQQALQGDYKNLEVLAFEMETTIAALEEELATAYQENEELSAKDEILSAEITQLSEKLNILSSELTVLQEKNLDLSLTLEKSETSHREVESRLNMLVEEKEQLALQLSNALLGLEEENAICLAKEKASSEAIREKANAYCNEVTSLSREVSEMEKQILSWREECEVLQERLKQAEEKAEHETKCSIEKSMEIDKLMKEIEEKSKDSEVESLKTSYDNLLLNAKFEVEELRKRCSDVEVKMHNDDVKNNKDKTKLMMRLRYAQAKLDAFRERYKEAVDENHLMNMKFEEASTELKKQLKSSALMVLTLKKQRPTVNIS